MAIPLGLGCAIYLREYASPRTRKVVKPILEVLAGIPTIVFGYFALTYFTPIILRDLLGIDVQIFNALSAGVIMAFMVLPTIASVSEDAMSSVPRGCAKAPTASERRSSRSRPAWSSPPRCRGCRRDRARHLTRDRRDDDRPDRGRPRPPPRGSIRAKSYETMTTYIARTAQGRHPVGTPAYKAIFAVGTTLFFLTLIMNAISIRFVRKYRQVYE